MTRLPSLAFAPILCVPGHVLFDTGNYCNLEARFLRKEESFRWRTSLYFPPMRYYGHDGLYGLNVDELECAIALVFTGSECVHRMEKESIVWIGE